MALGAGIVIFRASVGLWPMTGPYVGNVPPCWDILVKGTYRRPVYLIDKLQASYQPLPRVSHTQPHLAFLYSHSSLG